MLANNDVPSMMARVTAALAKGARARPSRTIVYVSESTRDEVGIGALRPAAKLQIEFHSGSDRPVVGPVILFGKRVFRRLARWYVKPIADQQTVVNNALLDIDQKILAEHERLVTDFHQLRDATDRLESLLDSMQADLAAGFSGSGVVASPDEQSEELLRSSQRLLKYSAFEDRHRGSDQEMRKLLEPYLQYFAECRRVVDIGCGRGEFVGMLGEIGVGAYGVDSDESMIEVARARGVEADLVDGIAHLRSIAPGAVDGVFSSQVAEHLTTNQLLQMVELSYRKVAPGGVVVMETPNPETLAILSFFFYVDLTHIKPIHPEALKWAHEAAGFTDVQILRIAPVPEGTRLEPVEVTDASPQWAAMGRNVDRLNTLLYGPQHYAVIARRPEEVS